MSCKQWLIIYCIELSLSPQHFPSFTLWINNLKELKRNASIGETLIEAERMSWCIHRVVVRSCLAAESLPELAELVLVHLALPLLLDAVRPHLRPCPIVVVAAVVLARVPSRIERRVYLEGGVEGEEEVAEIRGWGLAWD